MQVNLKIVSEEEEFDAETMRTRLKVRLEVEGGFSYNGTNNAIDEVIYYIEPVKLKKFKREVDEWK